jgi:hypothetical protein
MRPPPRLHLKTEPMARKKWAASIFRLFQQNRPLTTDRGLSATAIGQRESLAGVYLEGTKTPGDDQDDSLDSG